MTDSKFLPYGHQTIDSDDIEAVVQVLRGSYLTTGPAVERFEEALAAEVSAGGVVAVTNGTAALHAACFAVSREGPAFGYLLVGRECWSVTILHKGEAAA